MSATVWQRAFSVVSLSRSLWQFGSTMLGYLSLNAAAYAALPWSAWLGMALAVPAAGMVMRLFIVQHDCGHGSFWRRQHANHHGSFNNLDRPDTGVDLYSTCATVQE